MASIKGMEYEKKLLALTAKLKDRTNRHLSDPGLSDSKQAMLIGINDLFDLAHQEGRKLRKALAFLHGNQEALTKQLTDLGHTPDLDYGKETPR